MRRLPEIQPPPTFTPQTMVRSIIAQALGGGDASDTVRRNWPDDANTLNWIQRAGVVPTSTTTTNVPTNTVINALVPLLGPTSACGQIFKRALNVSFGTASSIVIPAIGESGTGFGGFIAQGGRFLSSN
jgi:hypothetical protein